MMQNWKTISGTMVQNWKTISGTMVQMWKTISTKKPKTIMKIRIRNANEN